MKQIQTGQLTCSKTGQVYLLLTESLIESEYISESSRRSYGNSQRENNTGWIPNVQMG